MKQIRKRITYANVMSSIAVFLVLGGATAFAASKIGSGQIKKNAITSAKIKKGAVTTAKFASSAVAPFASKPALFAHVDQNGAVTASQGIVQANVTKQGTGFYCISGLASAPVGGQATIGYTGSGSKVATQFQTGAGPVCPSTAQAFVNTRSTSTGSSEDAAFYLELY